MACGSRSANSQFGTAVLWHTKMNIISPKLQLLNIKLQQSLSSLDSFELARSSVALKLQVKSQMQSQFQALMIRCDYPQNADLPRYYSKKEKKPFPVPILELRRAARERFKNRKGQPRRPIPPPKNGLVVKGLIPVAYSVLNARIRLIKNLKKLVKVVPVQGCKWCNEIHVGPVGHPFKSCKGPTASSRKGLHEWGNAVPEDILVQVEAYHLYDRLQKRITREERFSIPRILQ
ncbi:hypothetical protein ACH5RR_003579 [Cinchona calisaya]|uniref:APO domain-containing protein n=1 Tax=Cinchona calisaya TaxID=153742 RepID=A0ABD3AV68_9GENT